MPTSTITIPVPSADDEPGSPAIPSPSSGAADDVRSPTEPPSGARYRRPLTPWRAVRDVARSGELLRALTTREYRARYTQTVLGMTWAVITPVLLMVAFVVFVQRAITVDTQGQPYALFAYLGLLPWAFFSTSLSRGGTILVLESSLLNKVRCPREVFPLSTVAVAAIDFAVSCGVLALLFLGFRTLPSAQIVWVPLIVLVQVAFTLGLVFVTAILVVYVRDVGQAIPLLLQFGLFATPVAYGIDAIPDGIRSLYAAINPLVGVISAYRSCLLFGEPPPWNVFGPSAASAVVWLVGGYVLFKRFEGGIADVA